MSEYKCTKTLRNVRYTDYVLCSDDCCDWPSDELFDFDAGEEYDFDDELGYRTGRCARVFVSDDELAEYFELAETATA